MERKKLVILILVAITVSATLGFVAGILYEKTQIASAPQKGWIAVNSWSGTQNPATTKSFRIIGDEWRISWSLNDIANASVKIYVYNAYDDSLVREFPWNINVPGEVYLSQQGRFYIKFQINGIAPGPNFGWYLDISEWR